MESGQNQHAVNDDDGPPSSGFKWRIENVSEWNEENHFSPIFNIGPNKWQLLAFRRGNKVDGYLSVYVVALECKNSLYAKFSLEIVDQTYNHNSFKRETEDQVFRFTEDESDWGFDDFIQLKELEDPRNGYIVNGACIIECSISTQDIIEELVSTELTESVEERDPVTMSIQQCDTHTKLDGKIIKQVGGKGTGEKVQKRSFGIKTTTSALRAGTSVSLEKKSAFICAFCQTSKVSESSGSMLHIASRKEVKELEVSGPNVVHVHRNCIDGAPQVYYVGETVMNLEKELARSSKLKCSCCGLKGAALGCFVRSCKNTYHVPCAYGTSGCQWDDEGSLMFCPCHSGMKFPHEKTKKRKKLAKGNSLAV